MTPDTQEEREIARYFHISIYIKGLISFLEVVAGMVLLVVPISFFTNFAIRFANSELLEEPKDFLALHLLPLASDLAVVGSVFLGVYILSRGLIKLLLIIALLKDKLWAYPSSLLVLALFMLYQFYQIVTTHSFFIIALTVFDAVVMYFIWKEWKVLERHRLKYMKQ